MGGLKHKINQFYMNTLLSTNDETNDDLKLRKYKDFEDFYLTLKNLLNDLKKKNKFIAEGVYLKKLSF